MVKVQITLVNTFGNKPCRTAHPPALTPPPPTHTVRRVPHPLGPHSIVSVSKGQLASSVGGETVILGLDAGHYYGVDAVGARVWQLIQQPASVASIRDTLVREYDVDPARCESDLLALLAQMLGAKLIEVHG